MPTVLSMCHGGICCVITRSRIAFAHGRACSYVSSDIGAIESTRWQDSHFSWKIGATSLVNVTGVFADCACAHCAPEMAIMMANAIMPTTRHVSAWNLVFAIAGSLVFLQNSR